MDLETIAGWAPTATIVSSALFVLAVRRGTIWHALALIAVLLGLVVLYLVPFYDQSSDLFILFQLMIMAVMGAATLVIMGVCIVFGIAIGAGVMLCEALAAMRGIRVPVIVSALICVALAVSAGLMLEPST